MKNYRTGCPRDPYDGFIRIESSTVRECKRRAFTVIELLAVLAVIAILASILFPTLNSATEKGNKTRCLSNLRQWGAGLALFLSDHDGMFPENGITDDSVSVTKATAWFNVVPCYMGTEPLSNLCANGKAPWPTPPFNKNVFTCPSLKAQQSGDGTTPFFSYAYNEWIDHKTRGGAFGQILRLSQIRTNAQFVVFGESAQTNSDIVGSTNLVYRHDGKKAANVCFADGHVSSMEASSLTHAIWNPEP
jgi:prepilin-type processing-associated H-X9-DG protein/prepilin-type N-terminal cleavage/methylation domain-containing protein